MEINHKRLYYLAACYSLLQLIMLMVAYRNVAAKEFQRFTNLAMTSGHYRLIAIVLVIVIILVVFVASILLAKVFATIGTTIFAEESASPTLLSEGLLGYLAIASLQPILNRFGLLTANPLFSLMNLVAAVVLGVLLSTKTHRPLKSFLVALLIFVIYAVISLLLNLR
ncbi:MAG: hypothetical protein ACTIAG_06730 [Lactobacillus sp.]